MKAFTLQEIARATSITVSAQQWCIDNLSYLNKPMKLLTTNSMKTLKGEKLGYTTAILYLQPAAKVARVTLCAGAKMSGCEAGCLISSGQLGMTHGQNAATKRTVLWMLRRAEFILQILDEVDALTRKYGGRLAIRLNGTSDIDFFEIISQRPDVQWYDYTKIASRMSRDYGGAKYSLTYSGSAFTSASMRATARAIDAGHNVVLAFNTKQLAGEFTLPAELPSYDETDLRFLDAPAVVR